MGIAAKRKITPQGAKGKSNRVTIPAGLQCGKVATIAADRLMIIDPRGEISENDLLDFLEQYVEPNFWPWHKQESL